MKETSTMDTDDSQEAGWDVDLIRQKLREWFGKGKANGFTYLLICQDTFDFEDPDMGLYPKYFHTLEDARAFEVRQLGGIDILMEVLDLRQDMEKQFSQESKKSLDDLD